MSRIDHTARRPGSPDWEPPRHALHRRLRAALHDYIARDDEKWAADRGFDSRRSASGWTVTIRDPRFDLRRACAACGGTGRHRITAAECPECEDGVVTLDPPEDGER